MWLIYYKFYSFVSCTLHTLKCLVEVWIQHTACFITCMVRYEWDGLCDLKAVKGDNARGHWYLQCRSACVPACVCLRYWGRVPFSSFRYIGLYGSNCYIGSYTILLNSSLLQLKSPVRLENCCTIIFISLGRQFSALFSPSLSLYVHEYSDLRWCVDAALQNYGLTRQPKGISGNDLLLD